MANSSELDRLVDKLIATYLHKGVQPDELATALYEEEYEDFVITKKRNIDSLIVKLSFFESNDDLTTLHKFKYTYEMSTKILLRIEQSVGNGKFKIQWDRVKTISDLSNSIKTLITPEEFRANYIDKLPKEISSKLSLVA